MDAHKSIGFFGLGRLELTCGTQTAEYSLKVNFKTIVQYNFNTLVDISSSTYFLAHRGSIVC